MANTKLKKPAKSSATKKPNHADMLDLLRTYVRTNSSYFLKDPNITSIGIGYKKKDGVQTDDLAVQFTVQSKVAPESVDKLGSSIIPPQIDIAGVQVPTDVIERSFTPSYTEVRLEEKDPRKVRADILAPGISIGNIYSTAGTLGCFVRDRTSKQVVILSNWHVLHGPRGDIGVDIVQPGPHDDNRVQLNKIGKLLRSHLGPAGDCAIASVTDRRVSTEIVGLGLHVTAIGAPALGDLVIKSGRTSAVTRGRVSRIEVNTKLDYGSGHHAEIGGFEVGIDSNAVPANGEISQGGDSGSVWIAYDKSKKRDAVMLGLHFAGDSGDASDEFALACYAKSVMNVLDIEPIETAVKPDAILEDIAVGAIGFNCDFLPFRMDTAKFTSRVSKDIADLDGSYELQYCHFSVWLSKKRKYPYCVAWNIDGNSFKRVTRTTFRADRRGDLEQFQLTNRTYIRNPLDKGHIARRADLCWGSIDEARQANFDSSYYTNIAPQHEAFNQSDNHDSDEQGGLWGRLENTVFDSEKPRRLCISVMAGPVFGAKDRKFIQDGEECLLPDEYWKVVAFTDDKTGDDKVFGFLLSQKFILDPLVSTESIDFDEWLWARITLADLESRTGVRFPRALHDRESSFVAQESVTDAPAIRILRSSEEYFL